MRAVGVGSGRETGEGSVIVGLTVASVVALAVATVVAAQMEVPKGAIQGVMASVVEAWAEVRRVRGAHTEERQVEEVGMVVEGG